MARAHLSIESTESNFIDFIRKIRDDSEKVVYAETVAPSGMHHADTYYVYHHKDCTILVRDSSHYSPRFSLNVYGATEGKVRRTIDFIKGLEAEVKLE